MMEDKKLNFVVATMPHADKFQLHIYAALAEQERISFPVYQICISSRQSTCVKLGGARPEAAVRHEAVKDQADNFAKRAIDQILDYRKSGKRIVS